MKALVLKEFRETFWLAALGLIVFAALLGSEYLTYREAMAAMIRGEGEPRQLLQPLLGNAWEYAGFFCAIFAAVLGGLQMFNERLRNVWAFFFHRPMTPTSLFFAKINAGLCVYAIVAGLPLLVFVAWAARPGNVAAPFDWGMTLPLATFYLGGVPYYFAGLLAGARRARWYASRILGLGAALIISGVTISAPHLWQVAAAILVGTVVLAAAAWACFCNSGFDQNQHAVGKPALAISLALGWVVVGALAAVLLADAIGRLLPASPWSYHVVLRDGSVSRIDHDAKRRLDITDLEQKPLLHPHTGEPMTWSDVQSQRAENVSFHKPLSAGDRLPRGAVFQRWGRYGYWGSSSGALWFFVRPERRLAGYDVISRRFIGSLGPNGFASNLAGEGFTILGSRSLGTATNLVSPDLSKRTVLPLYSALASDPISHVADVMVNGQTWTSTLVASGRKMHLISPEGRVLWTIDYSLRYPGEEDLKAYALETSGAFVLWNDPPIRALTSLAQRPPAQVTWVKDGRATRSAEVPVHWRQPAWPDVQEHVMAAFAPPFLTGLLPSFLGLETVPEWRQLFAVSALAALVCAPFAWIIARRRSVSISGCLAWSLGTLALGPPGLLALLSIEDTPPRETPRQPMPEIEIFEPETVSR